MNIEELDQWVRDRHLDYASRGIEIGDPLYEWELAHHPVPRCEGGTEMVPLLKSDHAAHGVLQSEVFQRPCIYGWEADFLTGDLLELCRKWHSEKGRLGHKTRWTPEERKRFADHMLKIRTIEGCSKGGQAGVASQIENKIGIYGASLEQRHEWAMTANRASDPEAPWWTDGTNNKKSRKCPGDGWRPGRTMNPNSTKSWWTNGTMNKRTDECPGEGWWKGCTQKRK